MLVFFNFAGLGAWRSVVIFEYFTPMCSFSCMTLDLVLVDFDNHFQELSLNELTLSMELGNLTSSSIQRKSGRRVSSAATMKETSCSIIINIRRTLSLCV